MKLIKTALGIRTCDIEVKSDINNHRDANNVFIMFSFFSIYKINCINKTSSSTSNRVTLTRLRHSKSEIKPDDLEQFQHRKWWLYKSFPISSSSSYLHESQNQVLMFCVVHTTLKLSSDYCCHMQRWQRSSPSLCLCWIWQHRSGFIFFFVFLKSLKSINIITKVGFFFYINFLHLHIELSKRAGPYGPARLARLILGLGP